MLIDARHREETRVAVVQGNRIEEFDFESAERKQLKGNIYLAKVTRVEPSLQAAFVDYGGNRHGFLAFSEIHPDYYQIPKEDREALLREEAEHAAAEERLRSEEEERNENRADDGDAEPADGDDVAERPEESAAVSGSEDHTAEDLRSQRMALRRRYKIQDVIRRRQVLLVQVVKEERGNKGAALTTYLSLAGRYCVLMPNTSHGGGISRKISNAADRKRLKSIMADLKLPRTMGCIVRTAGLSRTKVEIKRDFDYLARLWDGIREATLKASAPSLIYGDSDLIKRAIRDIYNRDIDEVIVEGEEGYRAAKDFMKLLMPSHARRVQAYSDAVPLFQRYGVEDQLSAMYQPLVQLRSGGYLVINPTEALVSIDINSGRSTREHGIEATAVSTNLEAAHEIARQLRLRDMAGLVVIDFIDMENNSNVRKVEKAMKAALANDRARIQVGRISSFGLMEMSRQRLRTGVLEASTRVCPHCEGTGLVRTASSAGLSALRMLEDEAARGRGSQLLLKASQEAAFYVLNHKRAELAEVEDRYGVSIEVVHDGEMEGARMSVEASGPPPAHAPRFAPPVIEPDDDLPYEEDEEEIEEEEAIERERRSGGEGREQGEGGGRRKRRRRGRRGRREEGEQRADGGEGRGESAESENDADEGEEDAGESRAEERAENGENGDAPRRRGRRGRRGGRRRRGEGEQLARDGEPVDQPEAQADEEAEIVEAPVEVAPEPEPVAEEKPARGRRRPRARKAEDVAAEEAVVAEPVAEPVAEEETPPAKPKRTRRKAAKADEAEATAAEPEAVAAPEPVAEEKPKRARRAPAKKSANAGEGATPAVAAQPVVEEPAEPVAANDEGSDEAPRRGWWQRTFGPE